MPETIDTAVYRIDDLLPCARDHARRWYRLHALWDDWYDSVFDDFAVVAALLGIRFKTRTIPLFGGGARQDPRIYFSGFSSQGDGACFEGYYRYAANAALRVRQHAPCDPDLHAIADRLQHVQRRNFYELTAETTHRGCRYHEYAMTIVVDRENAFGQTATEGAEEIVADALRDLARWLYRRLECEHDHLLSDRAIDESIAANDYLFTADGTRVG